MGTPVPSMTAYSLSGSGDGGRGTSFRAAISPARSRTAAATASPLHDVSGNYSTLSSAPFSRR